MTGSGEDLNPTDAEQYRLIVRAALGLACEDDLRQRVESCVERAECSCPLMTLVAALCGEERPLPRLVRY